MIFKAWIPYSSTQPAPRKLSTLKEGQGAVVLGSTAEWHYACGGNLLSRGFLVGFEIRVNAVHQGKGIMFVERDEDLFTLTIEEADNILVAVMESSEIH